MKRGMKFKLDMVDAMASAIEREIARASSELSSAKPEDFANEAIRTELMSLMLAVEEAKKQVIEMREAITMMKEMAGKVANDNGKPQEKASIGFTAKLKEAA